MFTSLPSLRERIERQFSDTPAVDPGSRIEAQRPSAPDLAALLFEPWLLRDLLAAGMPAAGPRADLPADERVRVALPYLARTRNSAAAWCFYRILRDLYDFVDRDLDASNYRDVFDRVASTAADPDWPATVVRGRARLAAVVTGVPGPLGVPTTRHDWLSYRLDLRDDFDPAQFAESDARPETDQRSPLPVHNWLDRAVDDRLRFTSLAAPSSIGRAAPADPGVCPFIFWQLLGWHAARGKTLQVLGSTVAAERMASMLGLFSGARIDLVTDADASWTDTLALARKYPALAVSGHGGTDLSPSRVGAIVAYRAETLPMSKTVGFRSDATNVEWLYGRLQLVKKATAGALASRVEAGFADEDEVPGYLRQTLHDTPMALYDIQKAS